MELHNSIHGRRTPPPRSPHPWSLLPPELLHRILACLPLPCLFRLRSVCKSWNLLPFSPHFHHLQSSFPPPHPWLILATPKSKDSFLAFDFATHSWLRLPLLFLPVSSYVGFKSSAGGRLLIDLPGSPFAWTLSSHAAHHQQQFVCNPLTKSLVALPPCQSVQFAMARGFAVDRDGKGFKVVVAGKAPEGLVIEVYDSVTNSWRVQSALPSDFIIKHEQMTECNGVFYSVLLKPGGILVCRAEGDDWCLQAMPFDGSRLLPWLVTCQNSLLVVGGFESDVGIESVHIWRFQPDTKEWQPVGSMSPNLCEDLYRSSSSKWFECVGVGNNVCFRTHGSLEVLIYDMCNKSWRWLPDCPYIFDDVLTRGFQLEPQLQD